MAATATHGQIQTLGTTSQVGVTPMIGVNDTTCENFTTANATALLTFAQDNDYINLVAFSVFNGNLIGQVFAMLVLTVAAAEAAVGLAILVVYFRNRGEIAVEDVNVLRG